MASGIASANVDQVLCRHMALIGHNELELALDWQPHLMTSDFSTEKSERSTEHHITFIEDVMYIAINFYGYYVTWQGSLYIKWLFNNAKRNGAKAS